MDPRQTLGRMGEDLACGELERRGWIILDRRFRTRAGEIDIVARDGPTLAFVEVRARASGRFGTPFESITAQKQQRLTRMAQAYLTAKRLTCVPCRFDVVSVVRKAGGYEVELMTGAFDMRTVR